MVLIDGYGGEEDVNRESSEGQSMRAAEQSKKFRCLGIIEVI